VIFSSAVEEIRYIHHQPEPFLSFLPFRSLKKTCLVHPSSFVSSFALFHPLKFVVFEPSVHKIEQRLSWVVVWENGRKRSMHW